MRTARIVEDGAAYYHMMSRVVDRRRVFDDREKELFRKTMRAVEVDSGDRSVANVEETGYGRRYSVDGQIRSPDGRNPTIRTVWIIETGLDIPRLITAYPLEEPK